jgi:hypothetical protein
MVTLEDMPHHTPGVEECLSEEEEVDTSLPLQQL